MKAVFVIFFSLFLLFESSYLFPLSSNINIKNEILSYQKVYSDYIFKGRKLLLKNLITGRYQKVKEIKEHLLAYASQKQEKAFTSEELLLLAYFLKEYNTILKSVLFSKGRLRKYKIKNKVMGDTLYKQLKEISFKKIAVLRGFILLSSLSRLEKDLLLLYFNYILLDDKNFYLYSKIKSGAERFLNEYPYCKYSDVVKALMKDLNVKYKLSKWGLGLEFFGGYGMFTQNLAAYYTNNVPIGVDIDIAYADWIFYFRDYIGFNHSQKNMFYSSGVWKKKSEARVFLPELSFGYLLEDNSYYNLSPFIGIAAMLIGPTLGETDRKPGLEELYIGFTRTYVMGINVDIKMPSPFSSGAAVSAKEQGHSFLRIRYALTLPQFSEKYKGCMYYISIGFGAFARSVKSIEKTN